MKKLSLKEMRKRKKKGFTLIELIIVIAIIAILAAIAIPKFGAVKKSANKKADIASAKNIATAAATLLAQGSKEDDAKDSVKIGELVDGGYPTPKFKGSAFTVDTTGGNITVTVDNGDQVYPEQNGEYSDTTSSGSGSGTN